MGYWLTVLGAAVVIAAGVFGSLLWTETMTVVKTVLAGLVVFVIGAEMALRHSKHVQMSEW